MCCRLLLSTGVLAAGSAPLSQLGAAIAQDKAGNRDRIRAVYSTAAGWAFGGAEHVAAPAAVKECIDSHEVLTYRQPDPGGPNGHEFAALARQLLLSFGEHGLLGCSSSASGAQVMASAATPEPIDASSSGDEYEVCTIECAPEPEPEPGLRSAPEPEPKLLQQMDELRAALAAAEQARAEAVAAAVAAKEEADKEMAGLRDELARRDACGS